MVYFVQMKAFRRPLLLALFLTIAATSAAAQTFIFEGLEFRAGMLWIGNSFTETGDGESVQGSDVSPLRFSPGISALFKLPGLWRISPGVDFFYQEYLRPKDQPYDKVVPTQIEAGTVEGDIAGTFGMLLSFPIGPEFRPAEDWRLSFAFSPTLTLRFPLVAIEGSDTGGHYQYFFSNGRFLTPELRLRAGYQMSPRVEAAVLLRGLYPVANLYADLEDGVAWWDEMMVGITLSIAYRFGGAESAAGGDSNGAPAGNR